MRRVSDGRDRDGGGAGRATGWRRTILLAAAAAAVPLAACDRDEPGRVPPQEDAPTVTVGQPAAGAASLAFPATVRTAERADLATRTSGMVVRVPVDVGDAVSRGDVVLILDDEGVGAQIRQAEAELERARRALARIEPLHADGAATDQELDDAVARFRVAEAAEAEARAQRAYTVLRAPFAGVVTSRTVEPGDLVVPGRPALTLAGSGALEVVADLPASLEGRVRAGDSLVVLRPETGERIPARVTRVSPALESPARRFRVEAVLPAPTAADDGDAPSLAPGAFVRLELPDPRDGTLWVPADAVVRRGQLTGVFTVEADTARLRWIRAGYEADGRVEVLSGLSARDDVVRRPPAGLEDGAPVRVAADRAAPEEGAVPADRAPPADDAPPPDEGEP